MQYNPDFLENTHIFNQDELLSLEKISEKMPLELFLNSRGDKGLVEWLKFDFVYSSSQIEGNTYDRFETLALLEEGITAGGKKYSDALMILNLRDAYEEILRDQTLPINKQTLKHLHSIITKDLLPAKDIGSIREDDVKIMGTSYQPLGNREKINAELDYLFKKYNTLNHPFDRALYLHNNLAYLQCFQDGNKRSARAMQFLSLKNDGIMPMVLIDTDKAVYSEYRKALIIYYESGDYSQTKEFFKKNYEKLYSEIVLLFNQDKALQNKIKPTGYQPEKSLKIKRNNQKRKGNAL